MRKVLFIFLLVLLSACTVSESLVINTNDGDVSIDIEIAETPEERTVGLMFREELGVNDGMLFIFDDEQVRTFWMKNTLIPLDMIHISDNKVIVDIIENAVPCESDPCPVYPAISPAKYVLEVNSGFVQDKNIQIGNEVKI